MRNVLVLTSIKEKFRVGVFNESNSLRSKHSQSYAGERANQKTQLDALQGLIGVSSLMI